MPTNKKPKKQKRQPLSEILCQQGLAEDKKEAVALIMAGRVLVNGQLIDKAGTLCDPNAVFELKYKCPYVGRGGFKLAEALKEFNIKPEGKICADVGCSTGGFTDVLLKNGAAKIYAIDSGNGELDYSLRTNDKVVVMERTNLLHLDALPEKIEFLVMDVSLLSLRRALPKIKDWLSGNSNLVILVKPQYEATREQLPPGAVIRDPKIHKEILIDLFDWMESTPLCPHGLIPSPVLGGSGNKEFLLWLSLEPAIDLDIPKVIESVVSTGPKK